ncbi:phosphoglycerate mutase [Fructilactobacillus lindneri]|nr:2,3-diphosphoglycerate-dependent phosphoglycerate mutase [Fructilactobacillus lindneri]ANZ57310.1 phosphoglycerate mutase [Fructilactobacillus lindneri]ANZ58575.1 phosphoglycerate mutase [Fructilactobacillus lindneri]POG98384.1 phosphoglycerate mutase [Fructilactobacillus lindneri]POH03783.1 phosphoglycerate mutase [Fructilactobacillus lindneri]POH04973.1 phosphoglycerate mutase [Fructilactobacillus lindneri]
MSKLVLMRHGESTANYDHTFTGWSDVSLTAKGKADAHEAGRKLNKTGIQFSDAHTSYLKRAIVSENIVLDEINQLWIPQHKTWRLNERHYGALRGKNKEQVKQEVGEQQFMRWRRSFAAVPPRLQEVDPKRRYQTAGIQEPPAESLKMAYQRLIPYWQDEIVPKLIDGKNQLVVAHGSSLRALIKYIENITDTGIDGVEVHNATPIIYTFNHELQVVNKELIK